MIDIVKYKINQNLIANTISAKVATVIALITSRCMAANTIINKNTNNLFLNLC